MAHFLPCCHANIPDWHSIREIWTEARWSFISTLFAQLVSSNMCVWVACCEMMGSLPDKGERGVNCYSAERNHQTPSCRSSQAEWQSSEEWPPWSLIHHLELCRPSLGSSFCIFRCDIHPFQIGYIYLCLYITPDTTHTVYSAGSNVKYWFAQNARKYCFQASCADIN